MSNNVYVCVCMSVCMCVCVRAYIYIHTHNKKITVLTKLKDRAPTLCKFSKELRLLARTVALCK